ncbi:hypothetical protein GUJ93_ZPchr0014g47184 [Zizania palustris]|uniref:Uncharacterized protein n=1 Tax=Zizania palustris TaxID=103762 RepID=A0A8J5SWH6_ZIZPA|nr:hypothetical protein GUJ93_ZPchr0014g47184 [Zizania palustris]
MWSDIGQISSTQSQPPSGSLLKEMQKIKGRFSCFKMFDELRWKRSLKGSATDPEPLRLDLVWLRLYPRGPVPLRPGLALLRLRSPSPSPSATSGALLAPHPAPLQLIPPNAGRLCLHRRSLPTYTAGGSVHAGYPDDEGSELRTTRAPGDGYDPREHETYEHRVLLHPLPHPYLVGFRGWALFVDYDFLYLSDLTELLSCVPHADADSRLTVACVKHEYAPAESTKMDGAI